MNQKGTATYERYVKRSDNTMLMPMSGGTLLPIHSQDDEQRIRFTLDDGSTLDFSAEPASSSGGIAGFVVATLVGVYFFITGFLGASDAHWPDNAGTSIVARAEQISPTYHLMYWLSAPHNQATVEQRVYTYGAPPQ